MEHSDAAPAIFVTLLWLGFGVVAFCAYWVPSVVAVMRKHHQTLPIVLVNLFFGWTFIGWVGALIWSVSAKSKT